MLCWRRLKATRSNCGAKALWQEVSQVTNSVLLQSAQQILLLWVKRGLWGKSEQQGRRPCHQDLPIAWAVVLVARRARSVAFVFYALHESIVMQFHCEIK